MVLPDELVERSRSKPLRERRHRVGRLPGCILEEISHCVAVCSAHGG